MRKYQMFIGGEWVESISGETIYSINPANGEQLAEVPRGNKEDIDRAVLEARNAFEGEEWGNMLHAERGRYLLRIAKNIRERKEELAELKTLDSGKPLLQAQADVEVAARYCEYYAGIDC